MFVNPLETVIDLPRHVSFETPDDLLLGQSLLDPPLHVVPRPGVRAHPDHDDPPKARCWRSGPRLGSAGVGWSCRRRPEAVPLRTARPRPPRSTGAPGCPRRRPAGLRRHRSPTPGSASNAGAATATTSSRSVELGDLRAQRGVPTSEMPKGELRRGRGIDQRPGPEPGGHSHHAGYGQTAERSTKSLRRREH